MVNPSDRNRAMAARRSRTAIGTWSRCSRGCSNVEVMVDILTTTSTSNQRTRTQGANCFPNRLIDRVPRPSCASIRLCWPGKLLKYTLLICRLIADQPIAHRRPRRDEVRRLAATERRVRKTVRALNLPVSAHRPARGVELVGGHRRALGTVILLLAPPAVHTSARLTAISGSLIDEEF